MYVPGWVIVLFAIENILLFVLVAIMLRNMRRTTRVIRDLTMRVKDLKTQLWIACEHHD